MDSVEEILSKYIDAALRHGSATTSGDYRLANKSHDEIIDAFLRLQKLGVPGIAGLLKALSHTDSSVRGWIATHLLQTHPEIAEPVLASIANEITLVGFDAKITLDEWRKGTLKFPPF